MTLKALPAGNGARSVVPSTQMVQGTGAAFATGYVAPHYAAEDIPSLYVPVPGDSAHQKGWGPVTTGNGWAADVITKAGADATYHGADPLPAGKAAFTWMSINVYAKDLWPAPSVFHARDTAHGGDGLDNLIDAALDYAATLGIKLWVHLYTGVQSPTWWLTAAVPNGGAAINGSGATMGNCPQSNSQTPNVANDCPVWWHPEYYRSNTGNGGGGTGLYYDLFNRIAGLYESNVNFAGIVVAGPMTVFPEPMARDLSGTVTGAAPTRIQILTADGGAYDASFNLTAFGSFLKGPAALPSTPELDGTFVPITLTDSTGTHTYPYGLYQDSYGGLSPANDILAHYYALRAHKAIFAATRQQYACNPYASLIGTGTNVKYFDPATGIYNTDQGNGTQANWSIGKGGYVFDNVGATFDLARAARKIDGNIVLSNESARFVMIPGGPAGHEWEVNPSTGKLKMFDANAYTTSPSQPGSKNIQYPHMFAGLRQLGAPYFQQTASASTDPTGDRIGAGVGDWLAAYMAANMIETPTAYNSIWAGVLGTERSNTSNPNTATYDPAHAYHSGDYAIGANAIPYKITFPGGGTYTGNSQTPSAITDPSQDTTNWIPFPGGILPVGGSWTLAGLPVGPIQTSHAYAVGNHVIGAFNMVYQVKKAFTTPPVLDDTDDPSQDTTHWKVATDARISWTPVSGVYDPAWGWFQPYPQSRSNEFSPSHYQAQTAIMQANPTTGSGSTPPAIPMPVNGTPPTGGGGGGTGGGGGSSGGSTPATTSVYPGAFDRFANRIKDSGRFDRLVTKIIFGMQQVQLTLGLNPQGSYADVTTRLNATDGNISELQARTLGWYVLTDPQWNGGTATVLDGTTDNTAALQAILSNINQATGQGIGIVWCPAGVVTLSATVTISGGVCILGCGVGNPADYAPGGVPNPGHGTTIRWAGAAAIPMFHVINYERVYFHDLHFQGNQTTPPSELVYFERGSADPVADRYSGAYNCTFGVLANMQPTDAATPSATFCVRYGGVNGDNDQFLYDNCLFDDYGTALFALDNTQSVAGQMTGCHFRGRFAAIGIRTYAEMTLIKPQFDSCTTDIDVHSSGNVSVFGMYTERAGIVGYCHDNGGRLQFWGGKIHLSNIVGGYYLLHDSMSSQGALLLDNVMVDTTMGTRPQIKVRGNSVGAPTGGWLTVRQCGIPTADYDVQAGTTVGAPVVVQIDDLPTCYARISLKSSAVFVPNNATPNTNPPAGVSLPSGSSMSAGIDFGTSNALGIGQLKSAPIYIARAGTITAIIPEITALSTESGVLFRVCVHADRGDGVPGALVVDGGTVQCGSGDAIGQITKTVSAVVTPGWYWVGGVVQNCISSQPTMRTITKGLPVSAIGAASLTTAPALGHQTSSVTGAAPNPFASTPSVASFAPRITITVT